MTEAFFAVIGVAATAWAAVQLLGWTVDEHRRRMRRVRHARRVQDGHPRLYVADALRDGRNGRLRASGRVRWPGKWDRRDW